MVLCDVPSPAIERCRPRRACSRRSIGDGHPVASFAARETGLGARLALEFDFTHARVAMRILSVPPAQANAVAATLRLLSGIRSVGRHRRELGAARGARHPQLRLKRLYGCLPAPCASMNPTIELT
jgi:hypothetical protein